MVRASDCQCISCNDSGFDPSIRRHSEIWGAAVEAVRIIVRNKIPQKIFKKQNIYFRGSCRSNSVQYIIRQNSLAGFDLPILYIFFVYNKKFWCFTPQSYFYVRYDLKNERINWLYDYRSKFKIFNIPVNLRWKKNKKKLRSLYNVSAIF